jgi:hypothetical protein
MARYSALALSAFMMVVGTAALVPLSLPQLASQAWGSVPGDAWRAGTRYETSSQGRLGRAARELRAWHPAILHLPHPI